MMSYSYYKTIWVCEHSIRLVSYRSLAQEKQNKICRFCMFFYYNMSLIRDQLHKLRAIASPLSLHHLIMWQWSNVLVVMYPENYIMYDVNQWCWYCVVDNAVEVPISHGGLIPYCRKRVDLFWTGFVRWCYGRWSIKHLFTRFWLRTGVERRLIVKRLLNMSSMQLLVSLIRFDHRMVNYRKVGLEKSVSIGCAMYQFEFHSYPKCRNNKFYYYNG